MQISFMASNYWGIPRTTHDLDFVVQLSDPTGAPILREFSGDFYIDEKAVRAAQQPPYQFNVIDTRSALKVLSGKPGLSPSIGKCFAGAFGSRSSASPHGYRLPKTSFYTNSFGIAYHLLKDNWPMRQVLSRCKPMLWIRIISEVGRRNSKSPVISSVC